MKKTDKSSFLNLHLSADQNIIKIPGIIRNGKINFTQKYVKYVVSRNNVDFYKIDEKCLTCNGHFGAIKNYNGMYFFVCLGLSCIMKISSVNDL